MLRLRARDMRKVPRVPVGRRHGVGISCMVAVLFAIGIWILLPKAFYAGALLTAQDDPVALADIPVRYSPATGRVQISVPLASYRRRKGVLPSFSPK